MESTIFFLCFAITIFPHLCSASHFYMGTISWKIPTGYTQLVIFQTSTGWDLAQGPCGFQCSNTTIGTFKSRSPGNWNCGALGSSCSMNEQMGYWHTGYNRIDNWEMGVNNFNYTFSSLVSYHIKYYDTGWVILSYINPNASVAWDYRTSTIVRLGTRSDLNRPNTSPKSTSLPLYRIQCNCGGSGMYTLVIPVSDADGDTVRCRWSTMPEAADSAESFPHATLTQTTPGFCSVSFNISGSNFMCRTSNPTFYVVALSLEDFPSSNITMGNRSYTTSDALSLSTIQFLVKLVDMSSVPCWSAPSWVDCTPADESILTTTTGTTITVSFYAQGTNITNVSTIDLAVPGGTISLITNDDRGRTDTRMVTWEWTPTTTDEDQIYPVCAIATDVLGKQSDQRCLHVSVEGTRTIPLTSISGTTTRPGWSELQSCLESDDDSKTDSLTVGIAVGVTVGILALGGAFGGVIYFKKNKKSKSTVGPENKQDVKKAERTTTEAKRQRYTVEEEEVKETSIELTNKEHSNLE